MKRYLLISVTACLISISAFSQTNPFPKGVYMSVDEILKRSPSKQYNATVEKRNSDDMVMMGGNEYKILSADGTIKKSIFKKQIWGYSTGDSMFVNAYQFELQLWYCKILNEGKYLIFYGAMPQGEASAAVFMGGMIAAAVIAGQSYLYVIHPETGEVNKLKKFLPKLLEQYPDLKQAFENEKDKKDNETLIKYITLINQK